MTEASDIPANPDYRRIEDDYKEKEQAKVVSQEQLADGIFSMWIQTEAAGSARPGQFISMYTNDGSKLLPRPISICEIDKEGGKLRVVYRVTGKNRNRRIFTDEGRRYNSGDRTTW